MASQDAAKSAYDEDKSFLEELVDVHSSELNLSSSSPPHSPTAAA